MRVDELDIRIELEALITLREGYVSENKQREHAGASMAYVADHFFELADLMRSLLPKEEKRRP